MLGKLLKYDLRSMMKYFPLFWGAALILAFINHFTISGKLTQNETVSIITIVIPILLFAAVMIGMIVLYLIFIIKRFYNGLLGDEGYLAFTLPVKPWQLITSKGLAAVIVGIITGIVGFLSAVILLPWEDTFRVLGNIADFLFNITDVTRLENAVLIIEGVVILIASLAKSVYQIYAAISLGHLFKKRRVLWSFIMYIAISTAIAVIGLLLGEQLVDPSVWFDNLMRNAFHGVTLFGALNIVALGIFLLTAVQFVAFHIISERVLSKKLNLE